MAGLCERCMKAEARSPHDLYCDSCEAAIKVGKLTKAQQYALEPTEEVFEGWIMEHAKIRRWRVVHFRKARTKYGWVTAISGDVGFPDLVLVRPPRLAFAELKVKGNKPEPEQQRWLDDLGGTFAETYCWSLKEWQSMEIHRILQ